MIFSKNKHFENELEELNPSCHEKLPSSLLERAVALDSTHACAHYHLARRLRPLGKKQAALDYLEKVLALGYEDPEWMEKDVRWEELRRTK